MARGSASLRLLVLDAYARAGREALRGAGGTEAGVLYQRMLAQLAPAARIDVVFPADDDADLPSPSELRDYDGVAWTGSSLTIHDGGDARVTRQIELARSAFRAGVPSFGSCWAAQLAVVAAGGRCARNPRGREFGVSRRIQLSEDGAHHPLFAGKAPLFDALTSHEDHVVDLANARCLASNGWSPVQAVSVTWAGGEFWAVQYHPEYDLHEVASLCRLRRNELVEQGTFADLPAAERYIDDLESLHVRPDDVDRLAALKLDASLLDVDMRQAEVRNWLRHISNE